MIAFLAIFLGASILIPVLHRWLRNVTFLAAAAIPAAAFVWTALLGPRILSGEVLTESVPWIPQIDIAIAMRMDVLAWIMTLIVTGIGALVLLYCGRYFKPDEPDLGRFAAVLLAFAGVMFGLVLADDIYLLFIFWEGTTVFSYLLIGQYNSRQQSRRAALQALVVTTAGGLAMLVGVILLTVVMGTGRISTIAGRASAASRGSRAMRNSCSSPGISACSVPGGTSSTSPAETGIFARSGATSLPDSSAC